MTLPNLTDATAWDDATLDALRVAVLTEQERRALVATAPAIITAITTRYAAATTAAPAVPWANLADRVAPGQQVTWTDGNIWQNASGAWLPTTATPPPTRSATGNSLGYLLLWPHGPVHPSPTRSATSSPTRARRTGACRGTRRRPGGHRPGLSPCGLSPDHTPRVLTPTAWSCQQTQHPARSPLATLSGDGLT